MERNCIIGIDCGSSTAKTVVFSPTGAILGVGRARVPQHMNGAHGVERDLPEVWQVVAGTVRAALEDAGLEGHAIASVGVTAHGDGLFLLDRAGTPLGRGFMSLDGRAQPLHARWQAEGVLDRLVPIAGQRPYPFSANTLLAWLRDHEPERYHAIGTAFFAKDWIRLCLTGVVATDLTEASTAFTDLHTQHYSDEILAILGVEAMASARPDLLLSCDRAGSVTAAAAAATGLLAGTPVAAGLHDVTAAAVGTGHTRPDDLSITAGTFSINEVFRDHPVTGEGWACRAGYQRGLWNCMAISPASSSNLEWLAHILLPEREDAAAILMREALSRAEPIEAMAFGPLFHPYLFGSPFEAPASAAFFGLQSWHDRSDLMRAVLLGAAFNHRAHVEALCRSGPVARIGLSGGGTGEPVVAQLFADVLGAPVTVTSVREAAALGAALTGAVAVGLYPDLDAAVAAQSVKVETSRPRPVRRAALDLAYARYDGLTRAMAPFWAGLYGGAGGPDGDTASVFADASVAAGLAAGSAAVTTRVPAADAPHQGIAQ
jgi:L-xylulokinase